MRYPFLDEDLIKFLSELPIHAKVDPRREKGIGDKIILRELCASLGGSVTSKEPKRAVQFGARTAKMLDSKQKGQDSFQSSHTSLI